MRVAVVELIASLARSRGRLQPERSARTGGDGLFYCFAFVKEGNDCKIVDHHSSAMPAPPR